MHISPARVRHMVRKEFRQLLRDPKARPILFLTPVIQLVLFGYAVNTDVRNTPTFVVDHDRTALSRELVQAFTASGYFRISGVSERPADMLRALDGGSAVIGLQIPPGLQADFEAGRRPAVQVLVDGSDSNTGTVAHGHALLILEAFGIRTGGARLFQATAGRGGEVGPAAALELRSRAWYNPNLESRDYNIPAVIGILLMIICLLLTSLSVVREREIGTLDQLVVTPLTPAELMLGKTIPVTIVGLIDVAAIIAVAVLWFQIPMRGSGAALLLAALLYIVAGLSYGLIISTLSRTQQEAFMSMFLFLLPATILSGFFYPIRSMPAVFQWLTYANPIRYFLEIVRGIFLKGNGIAELWPQYAAVALLAFGGLAVAIHRFRRSLS